MNLGIVTSDNRFLLFSESSYLYGIDGSFGTVGSTGDGDNTINISGQFYSQTYSEGTYGSLVVLKNTMYGSLDISADTMSGSITIQYQSVGSVGQSYESNRTVFLSRNESLYSLPSSLNTIAVDHYDLNENGEFAINVTYGGSSCPSTGTLTPISELNEFEVEITVVCGSSNQGTYQGLGYTNNLQHIEIGFPGLVAIGNEIMTTTIIP